MGRAPCCDKANVKKGPWSPEEDTKLKEFIEKYGTGGNWIALPQKAGLKRCGKSCRLRWLNYLRPNIRHGEFSDDEDRIICSLFASIGSRWSIIAAQLPGRTDNDIKNYWNTKLKKKLLGIAPSQRKPNRQHQSQLLFPSPPSSSSQAGFFTTPKPVLTGLEGFPAFSQDPFISAVSTTTTTSSLWEASPYPYQIQESSCNMIMFGGEQSCCSSDGSCTQISYGKEVDYDFVSRGNGGEQIGFESYLFGGVEDSHKLFLAGGGAGGVQVAERRNGWMGEAPLEYNYEEIKQLLSSNSNSGCCSNNNNSSNSNSLYLDDPTGSGSREGFKNQGRVMYEF